jgi:hypothetical protein
MKRSVRLSGAFLPLLLFIVAAVAVLGRPLLERTLFKDIPSTDPAREVIETVLGSRFYSMRDGFTAGEWNGGGYAAAWERARRYFPGDTYLVRPGTYFMTHGLDADGRLFMEVHDSAYLKLCVGNRRTFTPDSIVEDYGRMLAASDGHEAAAFREKTGRLEPFFRDQRAHHGLRKALGEALYLRLLEGLREEDYHMLAGGLMHEGAHAGMDGALVARIQAQFNAGRSAVQWDELRAFMAEIGYHAAFCKRAEGDIESDWRGIGAALGDLETLRNKPGLHPGPDQSRFERARARSWVDAALIRLRSREIWQSARRMQDLAAGFRKDYVRGVVPLDVGDLFTKLDRDMAGLVAAAGEAIQANEFAVRLLEEVLDQWSAWAAGRRPFPPPITDSRAIAARAEDILWPGPAADAAAALKKRAGEELEKERRPS